MNFTVRQGRVEDAFSIALVQVKSWKTTYAGIVPEDYLASLNPQLREERWKEQFDGGRTLMLVAEDDSGVFGFASAGKLRDSIGAYDAELYAIYLLHQKQKNNAGKALLQKMAEDLLRAGFKSLIVWVLAENPAVGFYQHLGGLQVAEKEIEIGGARLREIAFGWTTIVELL